MTPGQDSADSVRAQTRYFLRGRRAATAVALACLAFPMQAWAQDAPAAPAVASTATPITPAAGLTAAVVQSPDAPKGRSAFGQFFRDVGGDYKHFFSRETAFWYAGGFAAAGLVHTADEEIAENWAQPSSFATTLEGGDKYGNLTLQIPLAVGWWVTGHAMGSARGASAGRDLVRAQINATSWAYVIKYAVDRTRPNGDPRSFPSGHSTAVFASAMVLQEHYGWKVGVPFFAAATYTALSRLTINKHWASDVTMGAFVGMASARTVTLHLRNQRFAIGPFAAPGGGGVSFVKVQ